MKRSRLSEEQIIGILREVQGGTFSAAISDNHGALPGVLEQAAAWSGSVRLQ
jgi:hypothetical protein